MEGVHRIQSITDPFLAADLIGFALGLAVALVLLLFTYRAARLPGTPVANMLLAFCAFLWNIGGFARALVLAIGHSGGSRASLLAAAVQFSAAGAWTVPVLVIWRHFAVSRWQKILFRVLQCIAAITAVGIFITLWTVAIWDVELLPPLSVKEFSAHNAAVLLCLGAALLLGSPSASRTVRFASVITAFGVVCTSMIIVVLHSARFNPETGAALIVLSEQSVLLTVLGTFFLFTRFRFADLFVHYSLRILLAGSTALVAVMIFRSPAAWRFTRGTTHATAIEVFGEAVVVCVLLLGFALADRRLGQVVNRWMFGKSDYRGSTQHLSHQLMRLHDEREIAVAVEQAARETLEAESVCLLPVEQLAGNWPGGISSGEVAELNRNDPFCHHLPIHNVELLVPVSSGGQLTHLLLIAPGAARSGLVTREVDYLRVVAAQCGNRFDALQREREIIENQSREALLIQQVTEAELRALRAQINPHFLFNSLNTLGNLIVTDPPRAEEMTLRLARIFRYVLAHSRHALTTVGEELEFARTYLYIEEARFGDRLKTEIEVAPDVALERIPSLILQPIVENALKHGLAPKRDPGHLWIRATASGDNVCLTVEDDGVGLLFNPLEQIDERPGTPLSASPSQRIGLRNVADRLNTYYRGRASLRLTPRDMAGTCVTLLVPRTRSLASV